MIEAVGTAQPFPAPAGMNRDPFGGAKPCQPVPRACGDEPDSTDCFRSVVIWMPICRVEFAMKLVIWLFEHGMPLLFFVALGLLAMYPFLPGLVAWAAPILGWAAAGLFLIYGVAAAAALLSLFLNPR
jgi:hypothetical protein